MNFKSFFALIILMVSLTTQGFSQGKPDNVNIQAGPEIKTGKKEFIDKIIGQDESGIYVMAKYQYQMTLFKYNHDLSLKKKTTFKLQLEKKNLEYRGITQMGEDFFMFSTYRNKKQKMTYLYSQRLNKSTLLFSKPKVLAQASYEGYKKRASASYSFMVSQDSSFLMFITDLPTKKGEGDKFGLIVYDTEMNEVWSNKEIELDESEEDFARYDAQIGNDGKAYVLAKVYDSSGDYKRGEINYTFQMMVYEEGLDEAEVFDVTLDDNYMSDVTFEMLSNGDFQVVGFYSEQSGVQNGVFNLLIDGESYEVANEETTEFPTDFIVQHSSEKAKKKAAKREKKGKEVAFYSYDIDNLIENEDGTTTMVGEQYRFYQTCHTDANGNTSCTNHYIYGNIIIVKFDENGVVEWMELIPKFQHTINDGGYYSGYALAELPDGTLNFIFNDNPKNNFYETNGKYYNWSRNKRQTDIIMYKVDIEGKVNRYTLFNASDEEVMSRPSVSVQMDKDEIMILGEAKKTTKFFKVTFELE